MARSGVRAGVGQDADALALLQLRKTEPSVGRISRLRSSSLESHALSIYGSIKERQVRISLNDKLDIQELMARYIRAVDIGGSEEQFLSLFTSDGVMTSAVTGENRGPEGLKKFRDLCEARRGKLQLRHFVSNFIIDGNDDAATLQAYFVVFQTKIDVPMQARESSLRFVGTYDCKLRKEDGRWKIERRDVHVDSRS